uniref:Uncharacterized protein n=1 Tax=Oryza nivara TaxID=4536 RepID=A0A0E0GMJ7_ORYNI
MPTTVAARLDPTSMTPDLSSKHDVGSTPESSSAADPVALCHMELDVGDLFTTMNWAGDASSTM